MSSLVLAFEASSKKGGVALYSPSLGLHAVTSDHPRSHSEKMHSMAQDLLDQYDRQLADVDFYALGLGPGSFTGIRVAANTALAFAYFFKKSIVALDGFSLVSSQLVEDSLPVVVILNAFGNLFYVSVDEVSKNIRRNIRTPEALTKEQVLKLIKSLGPVRLAGDGKEQILSSLDKTMPVAMAESRSTMSAVEVLALEGYKNFQQGLVFQWNEYSPLYLRASEAEEKWGEVHSHGKTKS